MAPAHTLLSAATLLAFALVGAEDILYEITDEQYYEMPALFHLDDYERCLALRGVYCLGSFELAAAGPHPLYRLMQRYSANWVDNFNHTRLHRGVCVSRRCTPRPAASVPHWFEACVNETTMSEYNLSARLYQLEYCQGAEGAGGAGSAARPPPLGTSERAFAGVVAALLALGAVSTVLDLTLPDHAKKGARWALAWSVRASWRALQAAPAPSAGSDLRALDGLRVLCMMCVIIEHVCWITTHSYLADTRLFEQTRHAPDAVLMANSTLVVQIFFLMSSFLLAHKLLQQRRRGQSVAIVSTFFDTMTNRIIRVSPSYFLVVWFAASWWARLGRGPLWAPLVGAEAAVCRRKWWTHLLYLNNVLYAGDKCLIQTWYLAADMQLYAAALALTLALGRLRRGAIHVLAALLLASVALLFGLAYAWRLVPTFVMHRPESVRTTYRSERSFDVLYQSPLGNAPGALAGLLLAHLHHALLDANPAPRLADYKWFRWASAWSPAAAAWWVAVAPLALGRAPPGRAAAAALAALERPVFAFFVALALLGAMHGVPTPVGGWLARRGWAPYARLSFGALLLHMLINKSLVAARLAPTQLDRHSAIVEWFGVASVSYLAAVPLALLVELPAARLRGALCAAPGPAPAPADAHPAAAPAPGKPDL